MIFERCYGCMRKLEKPGAVCPHCGYDNAVAPAAQPNHVLPCGTVLAGHYVVGRVLGQGGFGITYIGWNLSLEIPICIKEYFPDGAAMRSSAHSQLVFWGASENAQSLKKSRESFVKEARKAVKLRSLSHVVSVWDVFYENETAYIVMDYIEGETLKSYLVKTQKPLDEKSCIRLLTPVMRELEKVHERGIIHRDIKPDNLMLTPERELILLDMGAAKDLERDAQNGGTLSSAMVVSQGFSPLEQYRTHGEIGSWTDVYAMCATIYYCVTGKLLPTPMDRVAGESADYSAFSPAVAQVLEKGLAIKPGDRVQNMRTLLSALTEAIEPPKPEPPKPEPPKPEPPKPEPPKPEPAKKKRILIPAIGLAAALLIAGSVYFAGSRQPDAAVTPAPTTATASSAPALSESEDGFSYLLFDDHAVVWRYDRRNTTVKIPAVFDGKPVTGFRGTFSGWQELESILIPNGITNIDVFAFQNCYNLRSITIPKSVVSIGRWAFEKCDSLKDIYYDGTRAQWDAITKGERNDALDQAELHCYGTEDLSANGYTSTVRFGPAITASGLFNQGLAYEEDENYTEALSAYLKAAEAGHPGAMNNIGVLYYHGRGVEQDYEEAAKWVKKAAEAGDDVAMINLGSDYENGTGVEQDYAKAMEWYQKADAAGNITAARGIGWLYEIGHGVDQNYTKAMEWYRKGANAGDPDAMYAYGWCYYYGKGIKQDWSTAFEWYLKAAEAGNPYAMNWVGDMYQYGQGVTADSAKADEWHERAKQAGYVG